MKYRPEIDGLRALAVVPVILFHAGFESFSGGFVGVDVFFVISGYLITTILVEDIENNRFSIANFYERRARRILPALFFVMIVCIPFAWMWMLPSQMKDFSQSLVAVSLFASNILFWRETGYFAASSEVNPLLHTWSLAVEEQYYLLFPVFLYLAWRLGKSRAFWMIVVFAAVSFFLSEWGWRNSPSANFYLAPTRAWELFAGSIAAFVVQRRGVQANNALSLLGLAAIFISIFAYDKSTPFPSVYALVPVVGVVFLVLFAQKDTLAAKLLSAKVFVGIGLISYSAYLWHQPLFAFARIRSLDIPSSALMCLLSVLSILMAWISWWYVERPFRQKHNFSRNKIGGLALTGMFLFVVIGGLGAKFEVEINPGQFHPLNRKINYGNYSRDNGVLQQESWSILRKLSAYEEYGVEQNVFDREAWFTADSGLSKLLIVGNSHSKDIFNILVQSDSVQTSYEVARYGVQIRNLTDKHKFWTSPNYLSATHVVLATLFSDSDLNNVDFVLKKFARDGKKAILVKNIFTFPGEVSGHSLIDSIAHQSYVKGLTVSEAAAAINQAYYDYYVNNEDASISINAELERIASTQGVIVLDRIKYVCEMQIRVCFAVQSDLSKNFYDYGHHTLIGSRFFAARVDTLNWFYVK